MHALCVHVCAVKSRPEFYRHMKLLHSLRPRKEGSFKAKNIWQPCFNQWLASNGNSQVEAFGLLYLRNSWLPRSFFLSCSLLKSPAQIWQPDNPPTKLPWPQQSWESFTYTKPAVNRHFSKTGVLLACISPSIWPNMFHPLHIPLRPKTARPPPA